eukprot:291031-Prymnesium_polylepis.1
MALQWMPVLITYLTSVPASETRPTAAELLRRAELTPHRLAQVAFVNRHATGCGDCQLVGLDGSVPSLSVDPDASPVDAVRRWRGWPTLYPWRTSGGRLSSMRS